MQLFTAHEHLRDQGCFGHIFNLDEGGSRTWLFVVDKAASREVNGLVAIDTSVYNNTVSYKICLGLQRTAFLQI